MASKRGAIDSADLVKLATGAGIAAAGAALAYVAEWITESDFGTWTPTVTAVAAIVVNVARKWLAENSPG